MNEKINGGISTMRGIFCRLSFQKGGITAETIAAQDFDGGIFSVDTRQQNPVTAMVTGFCAFLTKHQKRGNLLKSQLNFFFLHQSLLIAEDSNKRNNC